MNLPTGALATELVFSAHNRYSPGACRHRPPTAWGALDCQAAPA